MMDDDAIHSLDAHLLAMDTARRKQQAEQEAQLKHFERVAAALTKLYAQQAKAAEQRAEFERLAEQLSQLEAETQRAIEKLKGALANGILTLHNLGVDPDVIVGITGPMHEAERQAKARITRNNSDKSNEGRETP